VRYTPDKITVRHERGLEQAIARESGMVRALMLGFE